MGLIISISGKIGSGKDTVAKMTQEQYPELDFKVLKFAGRLKEIASLLTGIPLEKFEDQEFKKTKLGKEWNHMTVREFLQKLGTEAMREGLHQQTWVNALLAQIKPEGNYIITDTRFPNELEALEKVGAHTIKVVREETDRLAGNHPSETALDNATFSIIMENNGSLQELNETVGIVADYILETAEAAEELKEKLTLSDEDSILMTYHMEGQFIHHMLTGESGDDLVSFEDYKANLSEEKKKELLEEGGSQMFLDALKNIK